AARHRRWAKPSTSSLRRTRHERARPPRAANSGRHLRGPVRSARNSLCRRRTRAARGRRRVAGRSPHRARRRDRPGRGSRHHRRRLSGARRMSWNEKTWREAAREYHAARGVVIPAHEGANGDGREEPPPVNGPQDYGLGAERGTGHTSAASPQIKLIPFDEITLGTQRRDLVKGLIPRVGLTVIWGPPKCGKSFWGFDVMMHIALGWKYRDRRVNQGPVVYCAFEGAKGFEARKEAFQRRYLAEHQERVPFFLEPVTLDLVRDHGALIATIKTQLA